MGIPAERGDAHYEGFTPGEKAVRFGIPIPDLPQSDIPITVPELEQIPHPLDYSWLGLQQGLQDRIDMIASQAGTSLLIVEAPENIDADFGVAIHRLAPHFRKSPADIATTLSKSENLHQLPPHVAGVKAEGAFLNFDVDMESAGAEILGQVESLGDRYGEQNIGEGSVVIIDCSSPNIAKYMSVGHLRSTVIGESLYRIYQAGGYTAIRDNHLGDWGTQFGMLGRAVELWGDEIPDLHGEDPVKGLYTLYVKMHDEIQIEKGELASTTGLEDPETSLEREGRAWFQRLENGDPQASELWRWSLDQSLAEFQRVYDLLGVDFEYKLGESHYIGMLPDVVSSLSEQEVSTVDEKGRHVVDLDEQKLPPLVIQKSDGTSLYSTRDLATLAARVEWFDPKKILYVVGGDQIDYFRQVFGAFEKMAGEEAPDVEHVSFGMVSLPEGKMSTRKGRVVFLEAVLEESIGRAKQKILESDRPLTDEQIDDIARQVGVGAVIYSDLRQSRERSIRFDLEDALSFEGNSGPYLQYAHARAKAILRRAAEANIEIDQEAEVQLATEQERKLLKQIARFPQAISEAIDANQPSVVADYTFQTAERFNKFYNSTPVLQEEDPALRNTRLRLAAASAQVIHNGLNLLGIEAPDEM